jgi:hypothetical protein
MITYKVVKDCVNVEYHKYGEKAPSGCFNVPNIASFECEYGACIVRLAGGDFYVDMGNEIAFQIRPLNTQSDALKNAIFQVSSNPCYDTWKAYLKR